MKVKLTKDQIELLEEGHVLYKGFGTLNEVGYMYFPWAVRKDGEEYSLIHLSATPEEFLSDILLDLLKGNKPPAIKTTYND